MNNGFFAVIILIIIIVFGGLIFYVSGLSDNFNLDDANNGSSSIDTNNTNVSNVSTKADIVAVQSGPAYAKEGSDIMITWAIKNEGKNPITNAKAVDQNYNYNFGTINPGESKSIKYSLHIPSAKDMRDAGFAIDDKDNDDELFIGGFSLSYSMNGKNYHINSNSITIILE